jgi:flagellar motor component MotA
MNLLEEDFLHQNNTYWGESTDRKFYSTLESMTDASEMSQDRERFIKTTFSLIVKAYLLPEYINSVVTNKISQIKKQLSPTKVIFGEANLSTD